MSSRVEHETTASGDKCDNKTKNKQQETEEDGKSKVAFKRPHLSITSANKLVESLYGLTAVQIKQLNSYDDQNFLIQVDNNREITTSPFVRDAWPHGYVLKIMNTRDSQSQHVEAEHEMMKALLSQGFTCPRPVVDVHGQEQSVIWLDYETREDKNDGGLHLVRLFTYIPGILIVDVPYTAKLLYNVGQYLATLETALKDVKHPALDVSEKESLWSLRNVPLLKDFIYVLTEPEKYNLISEILEEFTEAMSHMVNFQRGVIHGDFNEQNILVQLSPKGDGYLVHGIIDFGDASRSYYIYEVAIAITYMMLDSSVIDALEVGGYVLAGYLSKRKLSKEEIEYIKICIEARIAQSLTVGAYTYSLNPQNTYLTTTAVKGWSLLKRIRSTSKADLYDIWFGMDIQKIITAQN